MDDIFELLNWAHSKSREAKSEHTTYDDDSQADHDDGRYCGAKTAYGEIIKKCAELIAAQADRI